MSEPHAPRQPLLSPRHRKLLAIAFGIGLLLFLLLWLDQRNDPDFFKASPADSPSGDASSLPAPLPADVASDERNASGLTLPPSNPPPGPMPGDQPRIVEPPAPVAPAAASAPSAQNASPAAAADNPTPIPASSPAPVYPREALQRGVGGSVRVQVSVAADGSVERMELAQSSGNRFLDRAAMEAVRRWRFQPARRDGQPVPATVVVPLEFNPNR